MEKEQVEELLNLMRGAYPQMFNLGNEVGKAQLKMWRDYFLEWDYEKTKLNLRKHIESSVFAPTVAEINPNKTNANHNFQPSTDKEKYGWKDQIPT